MDKHRAVGLTQNRHTEKPGYFPVVAMAVFLLDCRDESQSGFRFTVITHTNIISVNNKKKNKLTTLHSKEAAGIMGRTSKPCVQ